MAFGMEDGRGWSEPAQEASGVSSSLAIT